MALYTIGDLHLSLTVNKPMDIFGSQWVNHTEKLRENFSMLSETDTIVLCGDLSWGMNLQETLADFMFVDGLPGRKIILKGNHDYWWTTVKKMNLFFEENGITTIEILNNNFFIYEENGKQYGICGTRGWFFEEETGNEHDRLILAREVGRLKTSLTAAEAAGVRERLVFLHYPPVYTNYRCDEILDILKENGIRRCFYGHIHSKGINGAFRGWRDGTEFNLISADFLNFKPEKITIY